MFCVVYVFGPCLALRRAGRYLKSFLEAVRFFLTEYEPISSHGDPIQPQNYTCSTPTFPTSPPSSQLST